ncbi:unnamed protein product [Fraxinus pennsylvanica]|uniref:C3H1-type domain-containing protein n=1 Tax=Fraxinus pennsylvanica TaxID=56036 RepID=A0AAD2DHD7_9LAMI|nr:unnamed protein product [Fraxinus pennsylvanica]
MGSASSIEKPQKGNPGSTPIDPISDQSGVKEVSDSEIAPGEKSDLPKGIEEEVKEKAVEEEEVKLRDTIERDIHQLTLVHAEIEAPREKGPGLNDDFKEGNEIKTVKNEAARKEGHGLIGDCKKGSQVKTVENENADEEKEVKHAVNENNDEEKDGQDVQNWKEEDRNEGYDENESSDAEDKGKGESGKVTGKGGGNRKFNTRRFAKGCSFYMKTGSCKFGSGCKFNHPPRRKNQDVKERPKGGEGNLERAGQFECKYYLTSGGCKYGKNCKYYHGTGKISISSPILEFNFLGLPIRPGEKECPYYMSYGSCKYGSNCRLHHPEPTAEPGGDPPSGYSNGGSLPPQGFSSSSTSSWSSPRALNETAPFVPSMLPTNQVVPSPNPEWNGFQAPSYPTSESSLPTPPAFSTNKIPTDMNFLIQHQEEMVIEDYPERPGEPECKYKSNFKFHQTKKRISKPKANQCSLNDKGLPLRPDQPICTHYYRFGICKHGTGCKYDHSSNFTITQPPYDRPPFNSQNS